MKVLKNKNLTSMLAVLLILSFVVSMVALPDANAQTNAITTWPFVDAIPHVAGVGQPVLINWGLLNYLNHVDDGWNVTLQITDPNGKTTNTTAKSWSTGMLGKKMSFSEPGNYTLQCLYDGESYNGRAYAASESEIVILQILEGYWKVDHPGHELPNEYWTRPVDSQLREWYSIMGSWVAIPQNLYAPWNAAPESAHILWSMPVGDTMGGLSGGDNGWIGFQNGDAYEGKFADSVILAGVLYYNKYVSSSQQQTIVAVDLHTGKILWEKDYGPNRGMGTGRIARGQILTFINENNRGTWAYLWLTNGNNMFALDAKNGDPKFNLTNVPSGSFYIGPNGELLKYIAYNAGTTANPAWRLVQWNSTHVITEYAASTNAREAWGNIINNINGRTFNAAIGYDLNISLGVNFVPGQTMPLYTNAQGNNAGSDPMPGTGVVVRDVTYTANPIFAFSGDIVIFGNHSAAGVTLTGVSFDEENSGHIAYNARQWSAPSDWADLSFSTGRQTGWAAFSQEDRLAVFWTKDNRVNYAFNIDTGRFAWETAPQTYADAWDDIATITYNPGKVFVYGKLIEASVGGIVYCYDAKTGELLWDYEATDKYNESYHTENWWLMPIAVSDGKIYIGHMTHSSLEPKARGAPFFALDCETGEVVWEIDGAFRQTRWGGRAIMGDSIIATMDTYDQQIYAIGKGPSEMTVAPSNAVTNAGNTVLITGTIMDVSPGTQSDNIQVRFSKGVPAVSDECMSEWMLYVYKQFERPMDTTGVEVTVFAQQGDNVIDIGTTVSDDSGRFSIRWTPTQEGDFDIYAYFSGSASYYGSWAKSEIAILETPEIVETKTIPYEWYIIGMGIAILAVLIIGILLILRKIKQ